MDTVDEDPTTFSFAVFDEADSIIEYALNVLLRMVFEMVLFVSEQVWMITRAVISTAVDYMSN